MYCVVSVSPPSLGGGQQSGSQGLCSRAGNDSTFASFTVPDTMLNGLVNMASRREIKTLKISRDF